MNKELKSIKDVDLKSLKMPLVTVYNNPADYPNKVVARVFDLDMPTNIVIMKNTVEEMQADIRKYTNMTFLNRTAHDEECVVGVWI